MTTRPKSEQKAGSPYSAPSPIIFQVSYPPPPPQQKENWWLPTSHGAIRDLHVSGVIWRCHEVRSWGKDNVQPQRKSQKSGQRWGLQRPAFVAERGGWWDAFSLTDYLSFKQENSQISALRKAMDESWKKQILCSNRIIPVRKYWVNPILEKYIEEKSKSKTAVILLLA